MSDVQAAVTDRGMGEMLAFTESDLDSADQIKTSIGRRDAKRLQFNAIEWVWNGWTHV